jgi:hypothetical protein
VNLKPHSPDPDPEGTCAPRLRRKVAISLLGTLIVAAILAYTLAGRGAQFSAALRTAPLALVAASVLLQIIAVLARTEAWTVCVRATGASVTRRILFRSAALGAVASIVNGSAGMAVRITAVRRAAPQTSPGAGALVAAEVPIITVELALVAIFSFTLVAPLGVPLWVPALIIAAMAGLVFALRRVSSRYRTGLGAGLAVLRMQSRGRLTAFALLAVCCQVLRNWLMLRAIGVDVSIFSSMALLIVMFTVGQLPIGPSTGPAATVLILGSHGIAATAAVGVLVTLTGIVGTLLFAGWALTDTLLGRRRAGAPGRMITPLLSQSLPLAPLMPPVSAPVAVSET